MTMPAPRTPATGTPDTADPGEVTTARVRQARGAISVAVLIPLYLWVPLQPAAGLAALTAAALFDLVCDRDWRQTRRPAPVVALSLTSGFVPSLLLFHELADSPWATATHPVPLSVAVAAQAVVLAWAAVTVTTIGPDPGPSPKPNPGR